MRLLKHKINVAIDLTNKHYKLLIEGLCLEKLLFYKQILHKLLLTTES